MRIAVWRTQFDYEAAPHEGLDSLRNQIDRQFGIGSRQSRVVLGDVDMLFDSSGRLLLIETRTSPKRWHRAELSPLPLNLENVWAHFHVELDRSSRPPWTCPSISHGIRPSSESNSGSARSQRR